MNDKLLKNIRKVSPYVAGEQPTGNIIKLNTNENPYPPSPKVLKVIEDTDPKKLSLYPNSNCEGLRVACAKFHGIKPECIFTGNGSDEVLALIFQTFFSSEKPIIFPDITYSFYEVWCKLYNIPYKTLPLDNHFRLTKEDYKIENGGIVIANPNAPTSIYEGLDTVESILKENKNSFVIIDEAYIDYGGQSALPLINKYDNLIVVRTFSKSRSLAGMRISYAIANSEAIGYLDNIKNSFNSYTMGYIAQAAGIASMEDTDYFDWCNNMIMNTKELFIKELDDLGFNTLPSCANFVFTSHEKLKAEYIFSYLKDQNIYVRYFNKPRINNYLRISIGTQKQMNEVIGVLRLLINTNL